MHGRQNRSRKPRRPETAGPASGRRRRAAWIGFALLVFAALGATYFWSVRVPGASSGLAAALPGLPDLTGRPALLRERLEQAFAEARAPGTALAGVAELGRLYHANNFRAEAEICWKLMRREQPDEARWIYYLADLRNAAGDQDGMIARLQETLRLAPAYTPARLLLANLQFKTGDLTEAARNFRMRLEAVPQDPYARLGLARLAMQAGRDSEARTILEAILRDAPDFATAHNLYAEILAAAGDADGSARHRWLGQETRRFRDPDDPWLDELQTRCFDYDRLCALGTREFLTAHADQARAFFARAIELQPGDARAYELMADLHLARSDPAAARDVLEAAAPIVKGRESQHFFSALSQAFRELRQTDDAIRAARSGLARFGDAPEIYDMLGLALAEAGRHEEAVSVWESGLARKPGDASMNYNQAISLLELRRLDDALAALDRSLTQQPTFLPTLLLRGEIELRAGHLDLAGRYLQPAISAHPANPQARRLYAEWQARAAPGAKPVADPGARE